MLSVLDSLFQRVYRPQEKEHRNTVLFEVFNTLQPVSLFSSGSGQRTPTEKGGFEIQKEETPHINLPFFRSVVEK